MRLFFSAAACLLFGFTSCVFFTATTLSFFSQVLGILRGFQSSQFTSLHAFDLFFDGAESCLSPTTELFFLSALPGFGFEIVTLFFGSPAGLFLFGVSERCKV